MGEAQAKLDLTMSIFLFIGVGLLSVLQNEVPALFQYLSPDWCSSSPPSQNAFHMTHHTLQISEALDESVQTAQDYAIMVQDPYSTDTDPDAWQKVEIKFVFCVVWASHYFRADRWW